MPRISTDNYDTVASWNGSQDLFVVEQPDGTKVATPAMVKQFMEAGDFEATGEIKDGHGNILKDMAKSADVDAEIGDLSQTGLTGDSVAEQLDTAREQIGDLSDSLDMVKVSLTSAPPAGFTAGTPYMAYLTKVAPHLAFLTFNMRFSAVTTFSNFETFFTYTEDITPDSTLGNCGKLLAPDGSYIEVSTGYGKGVIKFYSENVKANTFYRGTLPCIIA